MLERPLRRQPGIPGRNEPVAPTTWPGAARRAAVVLSAGIAALMVVASAAGLLVEGLYPDGEWAREALRGGDLVTLVLVAPLLIASLILSVRGSTRAQLVWIAMLGYSVYNYAYYVFGSTFNDVFLLHIALLSMSIFALACALPSLNVAAIAARFRSRVAARWIGGFLVIVGIAQGALWVFLVLRFAVTGRLLHDIPVDGQHLVFALDVSLLVPTLILAGILLYRRTPFGWVLGTAVSVFGAAYQLNLMLAGAFQANAGVVGVKAFPPEGIALTVGFAAASAVLLMHRQRFTEGV
ncbi:MAG: hypothetical protein ACRDIZ_07600 [Actinomycetota bacterium]